MASSSTVAGSSSSTWPRKLEEAQRLASEGARKEFAKDYSAAFASYVRAGETYLWLARTYDQEAQLSTSAFHAAIDKLPSGESSNVKARIRKAAEKVLNRAQLIKSLKHDIRPVERRVLSEEEQLRVLNRSSAVGKVQIPIWKADPHDSTFDASACNSSGGDNRLLRRENGPDWAAYPLCDGDSPLRGSDIVQDVINDCSFVASLEVAAEHDAKWNTELAYGSLFPKDSTKGVPKWSENGRHLVRLRFNGADRAVEIDGSVPRDEYGALTCAIRLIQRRPTTALPRSGLVELWPALLEKAYLSLRGGESFRGSNSSIDLHALTGWIPDHVGLHHAGFQREKMWSRIVTAFNQGNIMITAGTGKNAEKSNEPGQIALVNLHNYAILDVTERDGERTLLLMNPWRRVSDERDYKASWADELRAALPSRVELPAAQLGPFTMTWDEVCARLDALYISWRPSLFQYQVSLHAIWASPEKTTAKDSDALMTSAQDSQINLVVDITDAEEQEVWIHIARHVTVQEGLTLPTEWIAIHAFDGQDGVNSDERKFVGTYVDSTHSLIRFRARKQRFRIVASRQLEKKAFIEGAEDPVINEAAFTLTAYSNAAIKFEEVQTQFAFAQRVAGEWTSRSAGGNTLQSTFMHNPQYMITVPSILSTSIGSHAPVRLRIVVEANREMTVQVMLVYASDQGTGARIDQVAPGDIVCSSGSYSYGLAIAETDAVRANNPYVLIVSTYTAGQQGAFRLSIQTQYAAAEVKAVPLEGAGMHQYRLKDRWSIANGDAAGAPRHGRYAANPSYLVEVARATSLLARLVVESPRSGSAQQRTRPHINLAVLEHESLRREVVSSGPYAHNACGVAIRKTLLEPGSYVLVASTFDAETEADYTLSVFSDRAVTVKRIV